MHDVSQTEDNGFVAVGEAFTAYPPNNVQKMWVLKVDSVGCEIENCWVGIEEEEEQGGMEAWGHGGLHLWPNPAKTIVNCQLSNIDFQYGSSSGIYLSLVFYDIFGRKMQEIKVPDGQNEVQIKVEGFPPGIFLLVVKEEGTYIGTAKFVVSK